MTAAYVNAGAYAATAAATTLSPALPAALVAGNQLLAVVSSKNNFTHVWPSGWTKLGQRNGGGSFTVSWGCRTIGTSNTAPTITIGSSTVAGGAQLFQLSGTHAPEPFGAVVSNNGTITTHTVSSLTATRPASRALYFEAAAANTGLATPSGWTEHSDLGSSTGATRIVIGSKLLGFQGALAGAISVSGANAAWVMVEIELLAPTRKISAVLRHELEASASGEVVLAFATITHDDLTDTIRVVAEDDGCVSYNQGKIINYRWNGNLFLGLPFFLELLTDDERPPRGKVTLPDVEHRVGVEVLALLDSPTIRFDILKLSDFSAAIDADNARNPLDVPAVEYTADQLRLANVQGDAMAISGELTGVNIADDPWPFIRATKGRLPGLFVR